MAKRDLKIRQKIFYQELAKKSIKVNEPPQKQKVKNFWSKIWEDNESHISDASWIKHQEKLNENQEQQEWTEFTKEETLHAITKPSNLEAPENDGIANFWLKHLNSVHGELGCGL